MKHRCMCPKPDTMEYGIWQDIEYDNLLHFKPADRECERCGRPLCKDCAGSVQIFGLDWGYATFYRLPTLCPICAEEVA